MTIQYAIYLDPSDPLLFNNMLLHISHWPIWVDLGHHVCMNYTADLLLPLGRTEIISPRTSAEELVCEGTYKAF